ncbi:hypothetical protein BJX64DRAFT_283171 [Aspergillus heterothallicus]
MDYNRRSCFTCNQPGATPVQLVPTNEALITTIERRDGNMLNYDILSEANQILLCSMCESMIERPYQELAIYPTDLEYFIRWELRDQVRRRNRGGKRILPTAAQYNARGGTYSTAIGVYTSPYKHENPPGRWSGAPMAALHNAFRALGSGLAGIPASDREKLIDLRDLYYNGKQTFNRIAPRYRTAENDDTFGFGPGDRELWRKADNTYKKDGPTGNKRTKSALES